MEQYLKYVGLESYANLLSDNGYDDPDLLSELTEEELIAIGVKRGHAKRAFIKAREITANAASSSNSSPAPMSPVIVSSPSSTPPSKSKVTIGRKGAEESDDEDDDTSGSVGSYDGPRLQSKVLYEGFLQKKGNEGFFGSKVWAKRYFKIFEEGRMAYYKQQNDVSPINVIELRGALACEDFDGKQLAFKISMKTSARVYYLLAPSSDAKAKWISTTRQLITPPVTPKKLDPLAPRPYIQHQQEAPQCASTRFDTAASWEVAERAAKEDSTRIYIHTNGATYVEETRKLTITESGGRTWVRQLPRDLDDKSVHFFSYTDSNAFVSEQTYHHDEITQQKLLEKLIGKTIEVSVPRDRQFGEPHTFKGEVQYIPKQGRYALVNAETNNVHFLDADEGISFNLLDNVLEDGAFRPSSLEWRVVSDKLEHLYKLSYSSTKQLLDWYASYVLIVNPRESEVEFRGWYNVKNDSGKSFKDCNLVLVQEPVDPVKVVEEKSDSGLDIALPIPKVGGLFKLGKLPIPGFGSSAPAPEVPEKRVYRYTYDHKTDLVDQETKQLCFVSTKLPVKSVDYITFDTPKYTKYTNTSKEHGTAASNGRVDSSLIINWQKPFALPAGSVTLRRQSKDAFGADIVNTFSLAHYNPTDVIIVPLQPLGKVSAARKQTGFNFDIDNMFIVETFEIRVVNGREEPIKVIVEESFYRCEHFEISYESERHTAHPSHPRKVQWTLSIPPLDSTTINYSVFYSGLNLPDSALPKKDAATPSTTTQKK
ncbi:hypothetical protein SAMD00019534_059990 [Acytostelium subglobosum LB1]|uniref:hypothetical protein n=1 Tax=Acytostelium subglobosum LB1 TaxID=1410327 RepID=UPI000644D257|nr:hypothetical protein SAMD00019534_059990 [Acytostelium subglobosum LB1]GAM22824.1 hypothetical protein SAMD00019534_059990 [Acytostelium subglobosum LB1]|eukprot:XP_012754051.1 hypothetical protein SAMD00019534_059990 [Acytostelium subglobosum LB1]